jgi:hypothetical protein
MFAQLTLRLNFLTLTPPGARGYWPVNPAQQRPFGTVLAAASNLRYLTLIFEDERNENRYSPGNRFLPSRVALENIFGDVIFPHLEHLCLGRFTTLTDYLTSFLCRHTTLRNLGLYDLQMAGVMGFEGFFEFMRRDLRLEEASFSGKWRIYNPVENHVQAIKNLQHQEK